MVIFQSQIAHTTCHMWIGWPMRFDTHNHSLDKEEKKKKIVCVFSQWMIVGEIDKCWGKNNNCNNCVRVGNTWTFCLRLRRHIWNIKYVVYQSPKLSFSPLWMWKRNLKSASKKFCGWVATLIWPHVDLDIWIATWLPPRTPSKS